MGKECTICHSEGKYKCPTCSIYYCSVKCCQEHKQSNCEPQIKQNDLKTDEEKTYEYNPRSGVQKDKLELLNDSEEVKKLLKDNVHLRNLLVTIDQSENAEEIMQKAMQEPIFVEFADACLKLVDPPSDDER